jgi:sortase A
VLPDKTGPGASIDIELPRPRERWFGGRFVLRALGSLFLAAAVVLGAWMAWLYWGTGIGTAREQHQLRSVIARQIDHPRTLGHSGKPLVSFEDGAAMAIIQIPRIHLEMVVVQGTGTADLRKGPGHYTQSAYPWDDHGRVGIAGHRTTYLHPFSSLDKLRQGDLIRLVTEFGTFDYHVTGFAVVSPEDRGILAKTSGPTLVLTTCTPRFSASHRLVVFASR